MKLILFQVYNPPLIKNSEIDFALNYNHTIGKRFELDINPNLVKNKNSFKISYRVLMKNGN